MSDLKLFYWGRIKLAEEDQVKSLENDTVPAHESLLTLKNRIIVTDGFSSQNSEDKLENKRNEELNKKIFVSSGAFHSALVIGISRNFNEFYLRPLTLRNFIIQKFVIKLS